MVKDEEARALDRCAGALRARGAGSTLDHERQATRTRARGPGPALRVLLRAGHLLRARTATSPSRCAAAASRSSGAATACSRSSTSTTRRRPRSPSLERGAPGVYNVVDDEPAPLREWLPVYAEALGARPPRRVPTLLARLVAGRFAVAFATALRGASNAKAKRELGWQPRYPSWRSGFREALG